MSIEFKKTVLDNGLTVIGEVNGSAHTAAVGFFVNVGTRDETPEVMGVSHFLEHMCFKGTDRRSADDVNRDFDRIGASYNAMTGQEATVYYAHVLPEHLDDAVDLLADIMRPSLRDDDFEMEKNVILEEIGMYADRPFWVAYEQAMESFFGPHTLGYRILGTHETIGGLDADAMRGYFNRRYSPDNMVVSLSGKVDFDHTVAQLNALCGAWQRTGATRDYAGGEPAQRDETHVDEKLTNHYVVAISGGPSKQDESRYPAAVLAHLLGDSDGSRLYWNLIDPGLADEAELSHQGFDRTGTFVAYASCPPGKAAEVERVLLQTLDAATEGLTDSEVERARNKIAVDLMLQNERPSGRMMALGGNWLATGEYRSLDDELRRLGAVDAAAVRELCAAHRFEVRTVVRLTPGDAPGEAGA